MNIIRDGIILAVYLFIILSLYIFTSEPFSEISSSLSGLDVSADADTQDVFNVIDTVYAFMFVMLAAVPTFWFIVKVFERDPEWGYYE